MNPPSPVPAGTEQAFAEVLRQHRLWANWQAFLCVDCAQEFTDQAQYRAHVASALAAVVSSSPATPPCDRPHVVPVDERDDEWECTHEWIHEGYEYRCERCGVVNGAASSPATPEGAAMAPWWVEAAAKLAAPSPATPEGAVDDAELAEALRHVGLDALSAEAQAEVRALLAKPGYYASPDDHDYPRHFPAPSSASPAETAAKEYAMKCPRCESPSPTRHPAVQFEGEVQVCPDSFHASTEDGRKMLAQAASPAETREGLAASYNAGYVAGYERAYELHKPLASPAVSLPGERGFGTAPAGPSPYYDDEAEIPSLPGEQPGGDARKAWNEGYRAAEAFWTEGTGRLPQNPYPAPALPGEQPGGEAELQERIDAALALCDAWDAGAVRASSVQATIRAALTAPALPGEQPGGEPRKPLVRARYPLTPGQANVSLEDDDDFPALPGERADEEGSREP